MSAIAHNELDVRVLLTLAERGIEDTWKRYSDSQEEYIRNNTRREIKFLGFTIRAEKPKDYYINKFKRTHRGIDLADLYEDYVRIRNKLSVIISSYNPDSTIKVKISERTFDLLCKYTRKEDIENA